MERGTREFDKRRNFAGPVEQLKPEGVKPFLDKQAKELGAAPLSPGRRDESGGRRGGCQKRHPDGQSRKIHRRHSEERPAVGAQEPGPGQASETGGCGARAAGRTRTAATAGQGQQASRGRKEGQRPVFHPGKRSSDPGGAVEPGQPRRRGQSHDRGPGFQRVPVQPGGPVRAAAGVVLQAHHLHGGHGQRVHAGLDHHRFAHRIRRLRSRPALETDQFRSEILRAHRPVHRADPIPERHDHQAAEQGGLPRRGRNRPETGHHLGTAKQPVLGTRLPGHFHARDGHGVFDLRQHGRAGGPHVHHQGPGSGRQRAGGDQAETDPGHQFRHGLHHQLHAAGRGGAGHRQPGQGPGTSGRRQDRHDQRPVRRLVRRLHARIHHRSLGRPGRHGTDGPTAKAAAWRPRPFFCTTCRMS